MRSRSEPTAANLYNRDGFPAMPFKSAEGN